MEQTEHLWQQFVGSKRPVENSGSPLGPVIGPLIMCGVLIKEEDEIKLKRLKVRDSKLLTSRQRETLFDKIKKVIKSYRIIAVEPEEIDSALKSDSLNLNWLEAEKSAEIINFLKPDKVIIDSPSNNVVKYKNYVKKRLFDKKIELMVEHKADVKYPVVSAASILAKVIRDREIEKIKKIVNVDFGSGYSSDPVTKKFVEENFDKYPGIFRESWMTHKIAKEMKNQKRLTDF